MWVIRVLSMTGFSALVFACASSSRATRPELTEAKTAISTAEGAGAEMQPKAALHLKMARDQVTEAERLMEDGKREAAAMLLLRARSDAELALALSREAKAQAEAREAIARVEELESSNR